MSEVLSRYCKDNDFALQIRKELSHEMVGENWKIFGD